MEIISELSGRWLELAAAVYLVGMVLYGHYKGFIRIAVSALALVITLLTIHVAMPYAADWLKNNTSVYETLKESMGKAAGLDEKAEQLDAELAAQKAAERTIIEDLELPEQLKRLLIENNNSEVYKVM